MTVPIMRVVAIIAVRNEALYIRRCLDHLQNHGVMFVVIDNESTDSTLDIVNSFKGSGLLEVVSAPFDGAFDLVGQMKLKEEIARGIVADWVIHQDADEVLEPPLSGETLVTALTRVGDAGYNAVNFDEFCFIPFEERQRFEWP